MKASAPLARRAVSRELTRIANASVAEVLGLERSTDGGCPRIGITGPPGAGKSSLIAGLARHRLEKPGNLAIVAVDPTSPVSGGAILGDRIRMEDLATDPRVYIRSLASRVSRDGLADNLLDILETFERAGFGEIILETVGVGQVEHDVRHLVDTTVVVLMPGAGDQVQAMKSGILEVADVFVVNKADQPGARQLATDLKAVAQRSRGAAQGWTPPVVLTSMNEPASYATLAAEVDGHQAFLARTAEGRTLLGRRRAHHVGSLLARRIGEVIGDLPPDALGLPLPGLYDLVVRRLAQASTGNEAATSADSRARERVGAAVRSPS
jgi:LAO/AO transport system kinase